MFRALTCPSSGGKIVFTQHLVKNCALKLVNDIIIYYDARSKKHQMYSCLLRAHLGLTRVACPQRMLFRARADTETVITHIEVQLNCRGYRGALIE